MSDNHERMIPAYTGQIGEVRLSLDLFRMARQIPPEFIRPELQDPNEPVRAWVSMYFIEHVGFTIELLSDAQVADWIVVREG